MYLQIKPFLIFRKGTATQLNWSVNSYERNGNKMQVSWSLFNAQKEVLESDIATLESSVVASWNSSDSVIDDALLQMLGIEKIKFK